MDGSTLSSEVYAQVSPDVNELQSVQYQAYFPGSLTFANTGAGTTYAVSENYALLSNSTEISYTVPPNTTLIEVVGPTGGENGWLGCYADFHPRPSWWIEGDVPVAQTYKPQNSTDQTLFFLPIDPTIQFTLRVGALGQGQPCGISGFRTYPFH